MSRTIIITSDPVARFSSPPADRMEGRPSRKAHAQAAARSGNYAPKAKPAQVSAATTAHAESFLRREQVLDNAMHQGVIDGSLRAHFATLWDADPEGTRAHLESLGLAKAAGQQPVAVSADAYDASVLSDAERRRITAAREGRQATQVISGGL